MARRKSTLTPNIVFDPRLGTTGRYVNKASGQIVSKDVVQAALEKNIDKARANITRISTDLAEGNMTLGAWRQQMADQMRIINTQSSALAKGGWANMSQSDWGFAGSQHKKQLGFLDDFVMQIQDDPKMLRTIGGDVNKNFLRRAELYADAGNSVKWEMETRLAKQRGVTHEMRELDPAARHCNCCIAEADKPKPIGMLKPIGACTCATKCRCTKHFGTMVDGEFVRGE